jgi:hypothetical protein
MARLYGVILEEKELLVTLCLGTSVAAILTALWHYNCRQGHIIEVCVIVLFTKFPEGLHSKDLNMGGGGGALRSERLCKRQGKGNVRQD